MTAIMITTTTRLANVGLGCKANLVLRCSQVLAFAWVDFVEIFGIGLTVLGRGLVLNFELKKSIGFQAFQP